MLLNKVEPRSDLGKIILLVKNRVNTFKPKLEYVNK